MPPVSRAQAKLMWAQAGGANIPGMHISPDKAREYVSGYSEKGLPTRKVKRKRKKSSAS